MLKDIQGKPAALLRADIPRVIYQGGQVSQKTLIALLLGAGLVFAVLTLVLLEKLVLARLARLSAQVRSIKTDHDLSTRIRLEGQDELSKLARAINRMLSTLESLHHKTQDQVKELQHLSLLKDDFLSTVSHELRTPVTNMRVAIQMLGVSNDPQRRARYLSILQDECEREISLVNDLLDLQRLAANEHHLTPTVIDLQEWLPRLVTSFQERAQNRQQILQLDLTPETPCLYSDLACLERILSELLNNACKYTPSGEKITLTARPEQDWIQFRVSNSGVEIPAAELSRIFDRFYRIPSSDRWQQGGTGLGLTLVQKLVEHLRGTLQVTSEAGITCFTINLPLGLESIAA